MSSSSSSGDEDETPYKRKRKVRRLPDSPSSASSGSPIIGASTSRTRPKVSVRDSTESDSDSSDSDVIFKRKKIPKVDSDPDFSSDSTTSPFYRGMRLNRSFRMSVSDESEDSDVPIGIKKPHRLVITSDVDDSQWETDSDSGDDIQKANSSVLAEDAAIDSDRSDGQSEKCPICLVRFKLQKVGVPENCCHKFCLDCILEWSKTINTCPVDRKEFTSITVRKNLNGKVLKMIPIDKPEQPFEVIEDFEELIHCLICGSGQNEDRLLLCDGCDLGYHLYCLTPPLLEVPNDPWYCDICRSAENAFMDFVQDGEEDEVPGRHRIAVARLIPIRIPRTRQSVRVRRLVENNRNQRQHQTEDQNSPSTSTGRVNFSRVSSTSTRKPKKRARKRKAATRYKTVWELDRNGEAVPVQRKVKSRKRKSKKKQRTSVAEKSVKKRLASQLGMCAPRNTNQILPDVRASGTSSNTIGQRRHQAGIPTLDLNGSINRLDYFSQSEDEVPPSEGIHTLLARRAPNPLDIMNLRRVVRRKAAAVVDIPTVSSSTDILDSIMDSQERFLSKNSVLSVVDSSGKLQIDSKKKEPSINNNTPSKPDFNSYSVRETPWNNGRNSGNYRPYNNRNNWSNNRNNWQNNSYQGRYGQSNNYNNFNNDGNSNGNNFGSNNTQGQDQLYNDTPQDYTQRTLSETETAQEEEEEEEQVAESSNAAAPDDGDIDIYGDIEMVSTSKVEDDFPSTSPTIAETPNLVNNINSDDDNDSESGMVIDTDPVSSTVQVYSPAQPTDSPDEQSVDDPQSVALEFYQLTKELSSGFNALQEMEKEFATGLQQFEPLMSSSEAPNNDNREFPVPDSEVTDDIPVPDEVSAETIPMPTDQPQQSSFTFRSDRGSTEKVHDDDDVSNDECPNFSIYSKQSKSVALHTDTNLITESPEKPEEIDPITDESAPSSPQTQKVTVEKTGSDPRLMLRSSWNLGALYSDSEDESVVKKTSSFAVNDIKDMTEDILSEEDQERSYTPVLDERSDKKEGLEGLDTEMISDDDRNDFDESHELKTVSDGDALEINAKESELEFTRPEDFEEGEIMNKNKEKEKNVDAGRESPKTPEIVSKKDKEKSDGKKSDKDTKKKKKGKSKERSEGDSSANKENMNKESFKKLTKNTKERNYRDKDKKKDSRERSRSKSPEITESEKDNKKKREKRKELERYNVRALIADKPRQPPKDQFGRDLRRTPSRSRSRSYTPPLPQVSPSRRRRTPSPVRAPSPVTKRKSRSCTKTPPRRRSTSKRRSKSKSKTTKRKGRSTSRSGGRKRDRSKTKKRKRSVSRNKRKKSKDKSKKRQRRSTSRRRSRSPRGRSVTPRRDRREWTPSLSRSVTPDVRHNISPSWTPPPEEDAGTLRDQNLTVILNNDATKKRKDKRNRDRRRRKDEPAPLKRRRRERERTPPPSKEVFASGDNILVSVSFNNENETRDVSTRDNRKRKEGEQKKTRERRNKNRKDLSGVKPVAIIDLERSPFQEIASSPKDIIVLSDSDNTQPEARNIQNNTCDSSQQVASPEATPDYAMGGPKTPPEPSVKFALLSKPPQLRAINNPLHDPLETIEEEVPDNLNSSHKGPNTPLEDPPNSAPSSPDAYDPFEPTKSRSATPEVEVVCQGEVGDIQIQEASNRVSLDLDKSGGKTPDIIKSSTPPMPDIQPADSQSSVQEIIEAVSPVGVSATQTQVSITKPIGQTIPFSSIQTTLATSTPVSSIIPASRINILSSIITPSIIPTRIVQPNQVKSSPVKILPTKAAIKSTPIKPIQSKTPISSKKPNKQPNGNNSLDDINLEFDSPYSPGSSDYEDLFEPPIEPVKPKTLSKTKRAAVKKNQSTFDVLFGSPTNRKAMNANKRSPVKKGAKKGSKLVGVKIDEDSLKILEDMPNSAVEMQVKDKFLKKLNRQERVVEEVKLVLKPYYNKKKITKDEYKDIMRRAVPKICHNKNGEINPLKIRSLAEAYVKKLKHNKKVTSSSSLPQKAI